MERHPLSRPEFDLIFDGGSRGNPGEAYGSFQLGVAGSRPGPPRRLRFGHGTNNEAEYKALIAALENLHAQLRQAGEHPSRVRLKVSGDSRLVINQVKGLWKVRDARMRQLHAEARRLLEPFGEVQLRHHPRRVSLRRLGH
jgi:ribonuclease HI